MDCSASGEKEKHENKKAVKAGFWYTLSNFVVKGIAFITMPIFTRIMSSYDIGMFSNVISWFNVLAIITTFEIFSSINIARFDYKDELDSYVSSTLILETFITATFYVIALIFHNSVENLLMINFETLNIIFIYLLVYPAIQTFQIRHQIDYDYKPIIKVSILSSLLSTIIAIIAVLFSNNKLMGRVYGYFIPLIVISIIVYIELFQKGKSFSTKYWKYALKISFPLIWHLLAGYLLSSADKIMITKLASADDNALYSVAYTISTIASILWTSMNNAWSPWAYSQMDKKNYNELKNKSKPYIVVYLIVIYLLILIAPELLLIMGGNNYIEAKYVMPPVMIGYCFQFVYSLYVNIEFYHKKQKNIAIGTVVACLINIGLNFIFIPIFGYIAAAYTTLIGYIVLYLIHYFFVVKLKCKDWYDNTFFVKVLMLSLVMIFVSNLLYYFNIIRYLILIVFIIILLTVCIKNKKEIMCAIKNKSINNLMDILKNSLKFNFKKTIK